MQTPIKKRPANEYGSPPARPFKAQKTMSLPKISKVDLRRAILKEIAKNEEVKTFFYGSSNVVSNAGANIANVYTLGTGTLPLSPYTGYIGIAQGTADGQRVGNKVKTKKAFLDMIVYPSNYNATTNPTPQPCIFKMWIYRIKQVGNATEVASAVSNYFKDSNSSSVGLAGTSADLLYPDNNTALQILYTCEHKIGWSYAGGTGGQAGNQLGANNDFQMCKRIRKDITKYLYSSYDFNDSTQTPLAQSPTWLTMEMVPYDGTITNIGSGPGQYKATVRYDYTDA